MDTLRDADEALPWLQQTYSAACNLDHRQHRRQGASTTNLPPHTWGRGAPTLGKKTTAAAAKSFPNWLRPIPNSKDKHQG